MENQLKFYHEKIKFLTAGYPIRFVNSLINDFESKEHDPTTVPSSLFNNFESTLIF